MTRTTEVEQAAGRGRSKMEEATALTDFSASRLALAGRCGLAFEYRYVKKLPAPYDRSSMMLGDAIHNGTQDWYELPDDGFKTAELAPLVAAWWEKLMPPSIWKIVSQLLTLEEECAAVEAAVKFQRPELKAPRQTKAYLESEAAQKFAAIREQVVALADVLPDVKWSKTEDPYAAYMKSMVMAREMQARWQPKPRPVVVERPFNVEIAGFKVRGRIDQVRMDPIPATGEVEPCMVDIKTGQQVMSQMEAFLQSFIYIRACLEDPEIPDTTKIAFYLARKNAYQQGRVDPARHERLASRILHGRARAISSAQFEPSYGFWCKSCDFADLCESEISLWKPGDDGVVAELMRG